jgi:hypothetical protein
MGHCKEETGNVHSVEQIPTLLVNDEKLKDPTDVVNAFNNLFTITEKLNIHKYRKEMLSQF